MKKTRILFTFLLLLSFVSVFSQASQPKATQESGSGIVQDDPKLSPEELALMRNAGEDNPAKPEEFSLVDPKEDSKSLPTEADYGIANAKLTEEKMDDPRLNHESENSVKPDTPNPAAQIAGTPDQPSGESAVNQTDYRSQSGGQSEQPVGETAVSNTDYRAKTGSSNQGQPTGEAVPAK